MARRCARLWRPGNRGRAGAAQDAREAGAGEDGAKLQEGRRAGRSSIGGGDGGALWPGTEEGREGGHHWDAVALKLEVEVGVLPARRGTEVGGPPGGGAQRRLGALPVAAQGGGRGTSQGQRAAEVGGPPGGGTGQRSRDLPGAASGGGRGLGEGGLSAAELTCRRRDAGERPWRAGGPVVEMRRRGGWR